MMQGIYYSFCCSMLTTGTLVNLQARIEKKESDNHLLTALNNTKQALALGSIFASAATMVPNFSQQGISAVLFMPSVISLTISGAAYLARRSNSFSAQMNAVDQNLGKLLDIASRIASTLMIVLLAPKASLKPHLFTFAAAVVAFNLMHAHFADPKSATEKDQIASA